MSTPPQNPSGEASAPRFDDPTRDIRLPSLPDRPPAIVRPEWQTHVRQAASDPSPPSPVEQPEPGSPPSEDRPPATAEMAAADLATPPIHHDEPTVTLADVRKDPRRTLEFGTPAPVKVTVGPRQKPGRRYRTWPWIAAVVLALVVLGTVLLVMLLQGETIDGDTDVIGSGRHLALGFAAASSAD